jgi:hypothetical protein
MNSLAGQHLCQGLRDHNHVAGTQIGDPPLAAEAWRSSVEDLQLGLNRPGFGRSLPGEGIPGQARSSSTGPSSFYRCQHPEQAGPPSLLQRERDAEAAVVADRRAGDGGAEGTRAIAGQDEIDPQKPRAQELHRVGPPGPARTLAGLDLCVEQTAGKIARRGSSPRARWLVEG